MYPTYDRSLRRYNPEIVHSLHPSQSPYLETDEEDGILRMSSGGHPSHHYGSLHPDVAYHNPHGFSPMNSASFSRSNSVLHPGTPVSRGHSPIHPVASFSPSEMYDSYIPFGGGETPDPYMHAFRRSGSNLSKASSSDTSTDYFEEDTSRPVSGNSNSSSSSRKTYDQEYDDTKARMELMRLTARENAADAANATSARSKGSRRRF